MRSPVWVCYGGGTDSTAMLVEMVRRGEPIDLITFADVGAERPQTYKTVEVMSAWLVAKGYPAIEIVRARDRKGEVVTLEQAIIKNQTVPSLAFGWHTCSLRFKVDPQVKFAKRFFEREIAAGAVIIRCIGYDASPADSKRACRKTTKFPDMELFENRYPLREWGWDRAECLRNILAAGLPDPGKSSCFFCPAMKKAEIIELKRSNPDLFERALEIEDRALAGGKLKSVKGLGRRFAWREVV